jgi:lycopene beta-cyclase
LVEFTVFSPALCEADEYDAELNHYVRDFLKIKEFRVLETEFGVIPMSDFPLSPIAEGRVVNIGTAGGFVKASSGYAFKRTQRKLRLFAAHWEKTGAPHPALLRSKWRYRFYDSVMLRVLRENAVSGKDFFTGLFQKLPAPLVFRFLDEDSTFADDIQLLSAPPTWPFFKKALRQMPVLSKI